MSGELGHDKSHDMSGASTPRKTNFRRCSCPPSPSYTMLMVRRGRKGKNRKSQVCNTHLPTNVVLRGRGGRNSHLKLSIEGGRCHDKASSPELHTEQGRQLHRRSTERTIGVKLHFIPGGWCRCIRRQSDNPIGELQNAQAV